VQQDADQQGALVSGRTKLSDEQYEILLKPMAKELSAMARWISETGQRLVVVFEGRDTAGKGGSIDMFARVLNPRQCRVVALPSPDERERSEWYFQRYVEHLPARGEIVLFDRSWYNRAGVEHVMGFCTADEYREFLRSCPLFEEMLVRPGIHLLKYWFSVSDEEQERRFLERMRNPIKRWKLSPMDLEARERWVEYSKAKDAMLEYTDRKRTPWHIVDADDKKKARLNCIAHLLRQIPYKDLRPMALELPPRQPDTGYRRPKKSKQNWVPEIY
jgi:polyphosphate kinase 2